MRKLEKQMCKTVMDLFHGLDQVKTVEMKAANLTIKRFHAYVTVKYYDTDIARFEVIDGQITCTDLTYGLYPTISTLSKLYALLYFCNDNKIPVYTTCDSVIMYAKKHGLEVNNER